MNGVVHSVVVASLIQKDWKGKGNAHNVTAKLEEKMEEKYEAQAGEIRKNISIAKAEMERLKTNKKFTKKEKKTQAKLLAVCKRLSVAEHVNYMEREKSND